MGSIWFQPLRVQSSAGKAESEKARKAAGREIDAARILVAPVSLFNDITVLKQDVAALKAARQHTFPTTVEGYIAKACDELRDFDLEPCDVRGPSHEAVCVEARRRVARQLRADGWSYPRIGRALGGRHHTTIMNLLRGAK